MSSGNDKLERELESFLADDSRVAALYRRLPKDEPSATLDAAILAKARAAVAPRRSRPRWLPAMSAAAALVVVAGLAYRVVPQVWNERSAVSEKAEQRTSAPAPQKPAADVAPQAALRNEPQEQAETSATPPLRAQPVTGSAIPKQEVQLERQAEVGELRDERRQLQEQKTATDAVAKRAVQPKLQADKQAARDNAGAGVVQHAEPEQRMKSVASPPRLDAAPPPLAETAAETTVTPAPEAAAAPKPASPPPAANAFRAAAGMVRTPPQPAPPASAPAPAREMAVHSAADIEVNLYPEHWISDIQQMLKDGRRNDAIKNLEAFRKRYPDYKLPDDLRDLK